MSAAFYWIGVAVVAVAALAAVLFVLLWLYFTLLHQRFGAILFRKSQRRLSLASWHASRLVRKGEQVGEGDDQWPADDWVINQRPFYLSYSLGKRRLFVMAGLLDGPRGSSILGKHPEHSA